MAKYPTIWAYIEAGELVHADERIQDLCCSPLEAVRYEAVATVTDTLAEDIGRLRDVLQTAVLPRGRSRAEVVGMLDRITAALAERGRR